MALVPTVKSRCDVGCAGICVYCSCAIVSSTKKWSVYIACKPYKMLQEISVI